MPAEFATWAGQAATAYTFLTGEAATAGQADQPRPTAVTPKEAVLRLQLGGLAADYQALQAEYALIAMNWRGRVAAVRHEPEADLYRVEFTLPAGVPPLTAGELRTMQSWLERCYLDTLRPSEPAVTAIADLPRQAALARGPADRRWGLGSPMPSHCRLGWCGPGWRWWGGGRQA